MGIRWRPVLEQIGRMIAVIGTRISQALQRVCHCVASSLGPCVIAETRRSVRLPFPFGSEQFRVTVVSASPHSRTTRPMTDDWKADIALYERKSQSEYVTCVQANGAWNPSVINPFAGTCADGLWVRVSHAHRENNENRP
jgi:hypothetical protein